ncbi:hypothetical protein, partial [Henriciella pelagia]|uniref:hypothetical protein n=1 Tax=Henriciella pelagia TaxID=1977912 RepID=UPI0035164999
TNAILLCGVTRSTDHSWFTCKRKIVIVAKRNELLPISLGLRIRFAMSGLHHAVLPSGVYTLQTGICVSFQSL